MTSTVLEEFSKSGYAVLRNIGTSATELSALAMENGALCGGTFWGELQDVVYDPKAGGKESIASTREEMLLHTDGSFEPKPPRYLFLQCVAADEPGFGESVVADIRRIIPKISETARAALMTEGFEFSRTSNKKTVRVRAAILGQDRRGFPSIRYRHDRVYKISAPSRAGESAIAEIRELIHANDNAARINMSEGDVLWIDNHRVLHGRTPLSGTVIRRLRAAWADEKVPGESA